MDKPIDCFLAVSYTHLDVYKRQGIASMAVLNEEPQAKVWAEEIMRASKEWFAFQGSVLENKPSNFDTNGGFYESVSYANFGVSEYLSLIHI